jgi:alpha-glucosidase
MRNITILSRRLFVPVFTLLSVMLFSCGGQKTVAVSSPDGKIKVDITTKGGKDKKSLEYSVSFNGKPIINASSLGLSFKGKDNLSSNMKIVETKSVSKDEQIKIPIGKCMDVTDKYNEITVSLTDKAKRELNLIFRVYNDGAAFRYEIPKQAGLDSLEITNELTSFNFTGDNPYWGLHFPNYQSSYETDYTASTISNIKPDSLTALPILIKSAEDSWVAITEAELTDYAGMYLRGASEGGNSLVCSLSPHPDSSGVAVTSAAPKTTPWRVMMIADNPCRLIESNIILCLSKPCAIEDPSWIKPGKTAWDWWSGQIVKGAGFTGKTDNRTMKHYIDFASETGLEYMLVDAGWYFCEDTSDWFSKGDITKSIKDIDVPGLVEYGKSKNVGIILWINWQTADRQMDEAFPLFEKWGVKGVKIDFMNRDDQYMVNFYERTLKKAAECHLTVDFHGAFKPTGIRRTYPNLLTREGVMGLEYSKWSKRITPEHDCTIPFTRMLAGPLDYTPGGFSNATQEKFVPQNLEPMTQGTRCHQLALYVVFESPLQMLPDYPENYKKGLGLDFLKKVPATWDETVVLDGQPGDYVSIARRHGEEWYIGAITDWNAREITIPLSFLGNNSKNKDKLYVAEVYSDGDDASVNAESVSIRKLITGSPNTLKIKLAAGGGNAVRIYPPVGLTQDEFNQLLKESSK